MTDRTRVTDIVAGYLAVFAIFVSGLAIVYRPVRLAPAAIVLALFAAALAGERSQRLVQLAVLAGIVGWLLGMAAAVVTDTPLW